MFMRTIARYQLHNAHSNEPALHHGQDKRTWLLAVPPDHQHARFACRWALKHLVKPGDSLSLVHVAQPALPPGRLFASASGQPALLRSPPRPDPALMVEAARRSGLGEQLLADAAAHPEVRSSFEVLPPAQGSRGKACVASTLCATAQERGAAALVLASSPRGGIIEALHGSVAARLVHDCDVPVVVLHPPSSGAAAAADGASTTADADAAATAAADLGDSSVAWLLRSRPPPSGAQPERRIMLAVDDSDEAAAAVEWVMSHVYRQGDLLHLLHIVPALPPHITSSLAPDGLLYSCPLPLLDEAQVGGLVVHSGSSRSTFCVADVLPHWLAHLCAMAWHAALLSVFHPFPPCSP